MGRGGDLSANCVPKNVSRHLNACAYEWAVVYDFKVETKNRRLVYSHGSRMGLAMTRHVAAILSVACKQGVSQVGP